MRMRVRKWVIPPPTFARACAYAEKYGWLARLGNVSYTVFTLELLYRVRYGTVRCDVVRACLHCSAQFRIPSNKRGGARGVNTRGTHARTQMNFELRSSSASAIVDVQQLSLSFRSRAKRRPVSSGLLARRARRVHTLRQLRAVEFYLHSMSLLVSSSVHCAIIRIVTLLSAGVNRYAAQAHA